MCGVLGLFVILVVTMGYFSFGYGGEDPKLAPVIAYMDARGRELLPADMNCPRSTERLNSAWISFVVNMLYWLVSPGASSSGSTRLWVQYALRPSKAGAVLASPPGGGDRSGFGLLRA